MSHDSHRLNKQVLITSIACTTIGVLFVLTFEGQLDAAGVIMIVVGCVLSLLRFKHH